MKISPKLLLLLLLLSSAPMRAQKRRGVQAPKRNNIELARQAIDSYDFTTAETILTQELKNLKRSKQDTRKAEALLQSAQQGKTKLRATENVVFIDSLVCDKQQMLHELSLSAECGRLKNLGEQNPQSGNSESVVYENSFGNKRLMALPVADSTQAALLRLAVSDKIGNQWSSPVLLKGLNEDDIKQNYPFLLSDGTTLYYAAQGEESMGGYDIFVTRADDTGATFLSPENIGFPYNSPANDYLLAIDEINQLGWLITDRFQPEGQVCIYVFVPNETRKLYADDIDVKKLRNLARINAISDTWDDSAEAARQRLQALRHKATTIPTAHSQSFRFILSDNRIYTDISQFRSSQARQLLPRWITLSQSTQTDEKTLSQMRTEYAKASANERRRMASIIKQFEENLYNNLIQLKQLTKEIRNTEISQQ